MLKIQVFTVQAHTILFVSYYLPLAFHSFPLLPPHQNKLVSLVGPKPSRRVFNYSANPQTALKFKPCMQKSNLNRPTEIFLRGNLIYKKAYCIYNKFLGGKIIHNNNNKKKTPNLALQARAASTWCFFRGSCLPFLFQGEKAEVKVSPFLKNQVLWQTI